MSSVTTNIESLQHEERIFPPAPSFSAQAHIKSMEELERLRAEATADPEGFWARMAEELHCSKNGNKVLQWEPPQRAMVSRRQLNISYNCLDRHLSTGAATKPLSFGKANPATSAHSPISSCTPRLQIRKCIEGSWGCQR